MKRFSLLLAITFLCLNARAAYAQKLGPEEEEAKRAIEARIAESVEAMRRKDTPARLAGFTPDWRGKLKDGEIITLKDLEEYFRRQERSILNISPETRTVVDTIELKGNEATVHTSQTFVRTVPGRDGPVEVRTSVTHKEVWVKTDRGWLSKYIEELEQGPTFVDGKEIPQDRAGWKFVRVFWEEGMERARAVFEEARRRDPRVVLFEEATLNNLGYRLIQKDRLKDAIEIFKLNTEAYPQAFNVWDSLGEGYMLNGDKELAIQNYKKSLELNPKNANAVIMLEKLGAPLPTADIWKMIGPPPTVELVPDITYNSGAGRRPLKMHVLRPKTLPKEPMPVIVFLHGGGWFEGHPSRGLAPLAHFAERGYLCATVEYRLSGEAKFPAQLEDAKEAVRFLRAKAREWRLDPDRIGVWGQSAGGHLAALLGTTGGVKELEGAGGWRNHSSRVQAVIDWNGPVDFLEPTQAKNDPAIVRLIGGPPEANRERAVRANPATYATPDDPPFLIIHGDADQVVLPVQSELLHQALKRAGVDSTLNIVKGAGHFGVDGVSPLPNDLAAMMDAFFDKHLKK